MDFSGSLTLTLQTEDDIILAAQFLQQRRQPAISAQAPKPATGEIRSLTENKILDEIRATFPGGTFSRAQANEQFFKIAGISPSKTGRILNQALKDGKLERPTMGVYIFASNEVHAHQDGPQSQPFKQRRKLSEKQRNTMRTLRVEMLYLNFKHKLEKLNPDKDIDSLINRDLEVEEALNDIKRKNPDIQICEPTEFDYLKEFRNYLDSLGIDNPKVQDLVIARMESDNPFSEEELKAFGQAQKVAARAQVITIPAQS